MNSDIELYEKSADHYDNLQNLRPDYVGAKEAFKDFAIKYFSNKNDIAIADFCCGTGKNAKMLSERLSVLKVTLIDINKQFLELANKSGFRAPIEIINSDILTAIVKAEHDLVISMFAYHHVKDEDKVKYAEQIQNALKTKGLLILGEIYMPDDATTVRYYEHLLNSISPTVRSQELQNFLMQTAKSTNFEYKVSRQFTHKQLQDTGFSLLESKKIWPNDATFNPDIGTFVEVWQFNGLK